MENKDNLKERVSKMPVWGVGAIDLSTNLIRALEFREREEDRIKGLAKKYVENKPDSYIEARSIVLDIHCMLDDYLNVVLSFLCLFGGNKAYGFKYDKSQSGILEKFSDIDYAKKMAVVYLLKVFTPEAKEIFWAVNTVRVAFAHGKESTSDGFKYKGEFIFKHSTIDKLVADQKLVTKEWTNFIEMEKGEEQDP